MDDLTIYLPTDQEVHDHIDRGSAIVGSDWYGDGRLVIDYEGGRYAQMNIRTFADKVIHAGGRHRERYPTAARMSVDPESVVAIGTWDGSRRISVDFDKHEHLATWLRVSLVDLNAQLQVT